MINTLLILASALGPLSVTVVLLVLAELSRRLGAVLKIPPWHRGFYLAASLSTISIVVRLFSLSLSEQEFSTQNGDDMLSLVYTLALASGVCLGLIITWRYWGWLVYASDGKTLTPRQTKR